MSRPLLAATFMLSTAASVVFPLIADLQEELDLPTASLGLVGAGTFIASLCTQLTLAPLADRGRSRALLLGGVAAVIASLVWLALAQELWQLVTARALSGIGLGAFVPAARAIAATIDPERPGENLGKLSGADLAGIVCGPLLGSLLAQAFGLRAPFVVLAVVTGALALVLARTALPEPPRALVGSRRLSLHLLGVRAVLIVALLGVADYLPVGTYDAVWARYLDDLGASSTLIGLSVGQ
jgi:predicted MFS family arabinose efflux permease